MVRRRPRVLSLDLKSCLLSYDKVTVSYGDNPLPNLAITYAIRDSSVQLRRKNAIPVGRGQATLFKAVRSRRVEAKSLQPRASLVQVQ